MRRARLVVDERELPEVGSRLEHAQDDLAAVLADEHHLDAAAPEDEEGVPGVVLEEDDAPFRVRPFANQFAESGELVAIKAMKERDGCEKVGGVGDHPGGASGKQRTGQRRTVGSDRGFIWANVSEPHETVKRANPCRLVF